MLGWATGVAGQIRHRNSCRTGFWRPVFQERGAGSSFFFAFSRGCRSGYFFCVFSAPMSDLLSFCISQKKSACRPTLFTVFITSPFPPASPPSSFPLFLLLLPLLLLFLFPPPVVVLLKTTRKKIRGINPNIFPEWDPSNTSNWKGLVPWRVEVHGSSSGMMATEYCVTRTLKWRHFKNCGHHVFVVASA